LYPISALQPSWNFANMFITHKTRMTGLPCAEKNYDNILSRFHTIPERNGQADGRTDRQTVRIAISISRVGVLTRDKTKLNY